ncbi:hypothetical protein V2J09_018543 [Rumex salicifolius]
MLVIKALGTMIPYTVMDRKLRDLWKPSGKMRLVDLPNGYYLVKFEREEDYWRILTGEPWAMFGNYVTIKPWSPNFDPLTDVIATTPGWVRFMNLPVILYEEQVLLHPASAISSPIKVDKKTLFTDRGRFARVCVELDLSRPLNGAIIINGSRFLVEYEGLYAICFHCGRFGHFQPHCPRSLENIAKKEAEIQESKGKGRETGKEQGDEDRFGGWMNEFSRRHAQQRRSKATTKKALTPECKTVEGVSLLSRFAMLEEQIDKNIVAGVGTQPRMDLASQSLQKNKVQNVVVLEKRKQQKGAATMGDKTTTSKDVLAELQSMAQEVEGSPKAKSNSRLAAGPISGKSNLALNPFSITTDGGAVSGGSAMPMELISGKNDQTPACDEEVCMAQSGGNEVASSPSENAMNEDRCVEVEASVAQLSA